MGRTWLLVPLLVVGAFEAARSVGAGPSTVVSVDSVQGLQQALADQAITEIHITRDLTFSESNWPAQLVVDVASGRSVTWTGDCKKPNTTWAFIDFGLIQDRIQLHKNTILTIQCLWIGNIRWSLTSSPGK